MAATAIILAGGKGERLRPLTEDRPKPMIPVLGNPLLSYNLRWLKAFGYEQVLLCCGYLNEVIQDHFGDGTKLGIKIRYLVEQEPLGRGGAFKHALQETQNGAGPILAMNGDLLTNLNLNELRSTHLAQDSLATVVTVPLRSPYGILEFEGENTIVSFREKPELPFWINAGIYMFDREIIDLLPDRGDHEETTFPKLAAQGKLKSFKTRAFWRTVDTVKDLTELSKELESLFLVSFLSLPTQTVV